MSTLETNGERKQSQQRGRRHTEDPNGNFITEKCDDEIKKKKTQWRCLTSDQREERKESLNWNIGQ